MKTSFLKTAFAILFATGLGATGLSAQIITNGSFETNPPTFPPSGFVNNASIIPPGWNYVTGGGLAPAYIIQSASTTFSTVAEQGNVFIGLQNNTANANFASGTWIYQNLSGLTIGQEYEVSFFLRARNASSQGGSLYLQLGTGNLGQNQTILTTNAETGPTVSSWEHITASFTATTVDPRLNFVFVSSSGDQMVFLDNISIAAVPEPSTVALLGLAMATVSVFGSRKRRKTAVIH